MAPPGRPLTQGEWGSIHPGLALALQQSGASPSVVPRAHPAARVAALWRGSIPVLTRGDAIFWPGAPADLSQSGLERRMAVLQHELQHVLDYRTGRLSGLSYLSRPHNWRYEWAGSEDLDWARLGAEQRASMAGRLWLVDRGLAPASEGAFLTARIPWARS
ncbi:MAG TPA: hypothetical protein VKT30_19050 [Caulobacteraceae bacterium]|nr:hypothetical protein [Caulobacteraceae bacterium]